MSSAVIEFARRSLSVMISIIVYMLLSHLYGVTKFPDVGMSYSNAQVAEEPFGAVQSGETVTRFTLTNHHGGQLQLITYGAAITSLKVADKTGNLRDVVLGFDNLEGYLGADNPYFGAIVGRVANRIAKGKFELGGVGYELAANNGENHLHGGLVGFDKVIWQSYAHPDGRVTFTYSSPHMDEGYPGQLNAQVTYTWTDANELIIDFKALTDRPSPVNLANHAYFNLAGHGAGSEQLYNHRVQFQADRYTPIDGQMIPTGEIAQVDGTLFDLRIETRLGDVVEQVAGGGYDHNFVVGSGNKNGTKFRGVIPLVAKLWHPESGIQMQVFSDQPGFQFYTGNFLPSHGMAGKDNAKYYTHGGLCIETQNFPDAINQPNFPDSVLRPGVLYQRTAVYKFGVQ